MGEQLERLFLALEVEAGDSPERLIFAGRSRENRGRRGHSIRRPQRSEPGVAVVINIDIEMADGCDALLGALAAAGAERIGGDIDVRAVVVLEGEPCHIARRETCSSVTTRCCGRGASSRRSRSAIVSLEAKRTGEEVGGNLVHMLTSQERDSTGRFQTESPADAGLSP